MSRIFQVTQETSKTTGVVFNSKTGVINTVSLTDAADTEFEFVVNSNKLYPESNIQLTPICVGTGVPAISIVSRDRFTFTVKVANVGVAAFNSAVGISVSIIG